jgi:hypothetical protein
MNQKNITLLQNAGYTIEAGRLRRARSLIPHRIDRSPSGWEGEVHGGGSQRIIRHKPFIRIEQDKVTVGCSCQDWRTRGAASNMPCKHILSLAFNVGDIPTVSGEAAARPATDAPAAAPPEPPFSTKLRQAIGGAIAALADQVEALIQAEEIPFLLGPTGSGKTSAVRMVAARRGWAFEEVAGSPSFADSDLVGLRTDHMEVPGVFARAFHRAREGDETVLLFLDELLRLNTRAMDVLMRPLQVTPAEIARAMGLAWSDIRRVEAPLLGQDWAPADRVRIALAANPWGNPPDPALVRRVHPLLVGFSDDVLALFQEPLRGAIRASWSGVTSGQLPLPMEYQLLTTARAADDETLLIPYLNKLRAVDEAAADGFRAILEGLEIRVREA